MRSITLTRAMQECTIHHLYCDVCDKELNRDDGYFTIEEHHPIRSQNSGLPDYDICTKCFNKKIKPVI